VKPELPVQGEGATIPSVDLELERHGPRGGDLGDKHEEITRDSLSPLRRSDVQLVDDNYCTASSLLQYRSAARIHQEPVLLEYEQGALLLAAPQFPDRCHDSVGGYLDAALVLPVVGLDETYESGDLSARAFDRSLSC